MGRQARGLEMCVFRFIDLFNTACDLFNTDMFWGLFGQMIAAAAGNFYYIVLLKRMKINKGTKCPFHR